MANAELEYEINHKKKSPTIMVHVSRKFTDGNYGSHGLDLSMEYDVPETSDAGQAFDALHGELTLKLKELLKKQYLELSKKG